MAARLADRGALVAVFEQNPRPYGKIEDGLPRWHVNLRKKEYQTICQKLSRSGALVVEQYRILQRASPGQACTPEGLHVAHEAEGPGTCELSFEVARGQPRDLQLLAADRRMIEVDRVRDSKRGARLDPNRPLPVGVLEPPANDERGSRRGLREQPGRSNEIRERRGAAVHDRDFGSIDLDPNVIDAE